MLKRWVATYAKSPTFTPSVVLSGVTHVALIGAAIAGTAHGAERFRQLPENSIVRFLAPPDRASGQLPQREMSRYVAIAVPAAGSGVSLQAADEVKPPQEIAAGKDERDALPMPELHGEDSVFSVVEVDSAATRYEWSAAPAYPPRMLEKSTEGLVRAEFIVSQDGYADTTTLRILESTHADFTKAVMDALPFMRFKPAKIGKLTVNQLVLQEFRFQVTTAALDSTPIRKPIP